MENPVAQPEQVDDKVSKVVNEEEVVEVDIAPEHPESPQGQEHEEGSENTNSPDIIPDHNSVNTPTPPSAPQRPTVSWAPMDQELAHSKIRDQRRLLKKQHRAIKYLKNEVASLKRKIQEMEQAQQYQGMNQFFDAAAPMDDLGTRTTSAGEHHPHKRTRYCGTFDDSSSHANNSFSHVSLDNSAEMTDPIPLEIKPRAASYPQYDHHQQQNDDDEETPNTFKVKNQPVLDPYGDKGTYSGSVSNSSALPHGRGRMIYEDNQRVYNGGWNNGRWHGVGQAIFANGDSYSGDYHMDQRHGRGRYAWVDGRVYEGDFKADKRHGKGVFTWPDGARYEGEFVNGFREGHGTYVFCGGCKYTGEWKDGRYNGVGSCMWTNGRCYSGGWRDGMRHGKGIETEEDGTVRHDGLWCDDEPVLTPPDQKIAAAKPPTKSNKSTAKTEKGRAQGWFPRKSNRENKEKN